MKQYTLSITTIRIGVCGTIRRVPVPQPDSMPYQFQILDDSESSPGTIEFEGFCSEGGLCQVHDWAQDNYGFTGFRAKGQGKAWEPIF